jgi:hypothetical protein
MTADEKWNVVQEYYDGKNVRFSERPKDAVVEFLYKEIKERQENEKRPKDLEIQKKIERRSKMKVLSDPLLSKKGR